MEPVFEIDVALPPRGSRERLRTLHRQLRAGIAAGRLRAGSRLPSTRALAQACGASRNLVAAAFDLLLAEGYVTTRPGGGTYVARVPQRSAQRTSVRSRVPERRLNPMWRDAAQPSAYGPPFEFEFDFVLGLSDKTRFPFDVWRRLSARALRQLSKTPAVYGDPAGRAALREAIAAHVSFTRAVACAADDVVVTSGAQQAFDLLARVLVIDRRTVVAVEDPGYPSMRRAFAAAGAKVVAVPVDAEGMVVERVPTNARIVCVTPSHQFPTGCSLSLQRRHALLEFARRHGAAIIEDDYDGEFRYGGRPLDALQTLDGDESVFYVGSFSKSLFPALRLGFVVAPSWARSALVAARQCAEWHGAVLGQDTLAGFIAEGHLARHVRKMRRVYGKRHATLQRALAEHGRGAFEVVPSNCGLHVCARLRVALPARTLAARAAEHGIRIHPLDAFAVSRRAPNGIVLGLGMIEAERIDAAVARLSGLLTR